MLVLGAGAISLFEGIGPALANAPPNSAQASATTVDPPQSAIRLVWNAPSGDPTKAAVEVVGADPAALSALACPEMTLDLWTSFLSVRVVRPGESFTADLPPLWGSYRVNGATIRFEPRFPLEPGIKYRAEFDPVRLHAIARTLTTSGGDGIGETRDARKLVAEYSPPHKPAQPTTQVAAVYPSGDTLPENLLRFYIAFTAPMSRGEAYRRIKLIETTTSKPIDSPFLELDEELWSPDGARFTLLLDPGRVKRGLRPREELGPVLEAGKSYSLIIDGDWPDACGTPLKVGFRKTFQVHQTDATSPDPKTWTLSTPPANSREPLEVRFPEPLDRALLDRLIWVQDVESHIVPGHVSVGMTETRWQFTPASPWHEGDHRLVIGTELEDVAGNSVARPFEVDATGPISGQVTTRTVALPFRIGPATR